MIIISGMGLLSKAVFEVANDQAVVDLLDISKEKENFGFTRLGELSPQDPMLKGKTFDFLDEYETDKDIPGGLPDARSPQRKPGWVSLVYFDHPLTLLYAHGGRRREASDFNYHFIVSGCRTRGLGFADSFPGKVFPGCIAASPFQFVVGMAATHEASTVQAWTISIQAGFEVIDRLQTFWKARQRVGDCFFFSATRGKIREGQIANVNEAGEEELYELDAENGPYMVEEMNGILNADVDNMRIHGTIVLNCKQPPCDALGGRIVRAVISDGDPLDIYLGEITEETDITLELA